MQQSIDSCPLVFKTEIRDGVECRTPLSPFELNELLAGRFPAAYRDGSICLEDVPSELFRGIVDAFDPFNETNRDEKPSGHIFFDRKFSQMSVFRAPTLVHEAAARSIKDQIDKMIWAKVQDDKFQGFINAAVLPLEDTAEFTTKVPDYVLGYQPEDVPEVRPLFIAEVGYSETYQDLVKAMKSWIRGMDHVKQALLVKFTETPKYSTSRILEQLPQNVVDDAKRYAADRSLLSMDVREGKLEINGCSFVGRTTAFVEKWTRDADSGKAVVGDRIHFYDSAKSIEQMVEQVSQKLVIDFAEFDITDKELRGESIVVDWRD
ncbi:hypothetical protein EMCG_07923 [[Emmonsia] crescens]|uniref:Uncharacterized protein n=1 Tax=[Emmonsia] crescens TaxID=73230 RepID=A0A0G2I6R0_9EURO|nr:hypothetical protein EMCG_07923 [Emmonsia crescens UAMH 3008]